MLLHDCNVHCITGRQSLVSKYNLVGALSSGSIDRNDFIDDSLAQAHEFF